MKNGFVEKNSIKQMFRMPVKTVSFFVMITAMGFLISLAGGMFIKTIVNIKTYSHIFKTIGTVTQLPDSTDRNLTWDAEIKDYKISQILKYDEYVTVDDLYFEDADYIEIPEKRSYYASYSPEYNIEFTKALNYVAAPLMNPLVEFSPKEDFVPNQAGLIEVKKILFGHISFSYGGFWFCDHESRNPPMLYKDKTYIAKLKNTRHAHGEAFESTVSEKMKRITLEFSPEPLALNLYDEFGSSLAEENEDFAPYYEITDNFYDTEIGKIYLNYADALDMRNHTFPVTGTNSTDLLLPFYNKNVYIYEGRDISKEAYDNGICECLISKTFAYNNGLKPGDVVTTNLLFTNAANTAEENYISSGEVFFDFSMLLKDGKTPQVFETKNYTVAGIYDSSKFGDGDPMYQLSREEMIVPLKSIEHKDTNILSYGPMNEFTTSFQIPNGTIDKYMESFDSLGYDNINITFYDMGYSRLEKGMKNMRFMAIVFGVVGIILGAVLLIFYSRMFIGGQKIRITIERCMGMTVNECRRSLLLGAMFILIIGSIVGCIIGTLLSGTISAYDMVRDFFDMTYTVGHVSFQEYDITSVSDFAITVLTGFLCEILVIASGFGILNNDVKRFLKQEPLYLIDDINKE